MARTPQLSGKLLLQASERPKRASDLHPARLQELVAAFSSPGFSLLVRPFDEAELLTKPEARVFAKYLRVCVGNFIATSKVKELVRVLNQRRILSHVHPTAVQRLLQKAPRTIATCTEEQLAIFKVFVFALAYNSLLGFWEPPAMLEPEDMRCVREAKADDTNAILSDLFSHENFLGKAPTPMIVENVVFIPTGLLGLVLAAHPETAPALAVEIIGRYQATAQHSKSHTTTSSAAKASMALEESPHNEPLEPVRDEAAQLLDLFSRTLGTIHAQDRFLQEFPTVWTALAKNVSTMFDDCLIELSRPLVLLAAAHYSKRKICNTIWNLALNKSLTRNILRRFFIAEQLAHVDQFDASRAAIKRGTLQQMKANKANAFLNALEWYLCVFALDLSQLPQAFLEHLVRCIEICASIRKGPSRRPSPSRTEDRLMKRDQAWLLAVWQEGKARSLI